MEPAIGVIMGSDSDWDTLRHAVAVLQAAGVPHERHVVSAHRTPERMVAYAKGAEARGLKVIIAGAGGAAHLPGMVASLTALPVLGVPVLTSTLSGVDSLLSIVQMPGGVPTATFSIGRSGAINAAIFALRILALHDPALRAHLDTLQADNERRAAEGDARVQPEGTQ